jgi:hypothetical protein
LTLGVKMKACGRCGAEKGEGEFGRNVAKEDGLQNYCRVCVREYAREHAKRKPAGWTRVTADMASYQREYRKKNKARCAELKRRWYERNPERARIKEAVRYAVKVGKLVRQPCFTCGEAKVEGHHADYDAPLDVVWLCQVHHMEVHKRRERF